MTVILKNNASGFLATSISATDTSIILSTGTGANFPSLGSGEYFYATITPTSGASEIVKCTARSSDTLTIIRAQEGTSALSFAGGSRVELRVTAQSVIDAITDRVSQSDQAAEITIVDAGNYYSSGNVEGALQEAAVFTQAGTGAVLRTQQAKMRDMVSVKDFGAVGNGTTNDTAAIRAALDASAQVYFPPGTYAVTTMNFNIPGGKYSGSVSFRGIATSATAAVIEITTGFLTFESLAVDQNFNINYTSAVKWHSPSNPPAQYNKIKSFELNNCIIGLLFGQLNGTPVVDAPQSENSITHMHTRGCQTPIYINQPNGFLFIGESTISSIRNEWEIANPGVYSYANSRIIIGYQGQLQVSNGEILKTDTQLGYGIENNGIGLYMSNMSWECASLNMYLTGGATYISNSSSYFSNAAAAFITITGGATGLLMMTNCNWLRADGAINSSRGFIEHNGNNNFEVYATNVKIQNFLGYTFLNNASGSAFRIPRRFYLQNFRCIDGDAARRNILIQTNKVGNSPLIAKNVDLSGDTTVGWFYELAYGGGSSYGVVTDGPELGPKDTSYENSIELNATGVAYLRTIDITSTATAISTGLTVTPNQLLLVTAWVRRVSGSCVFGLAEVTAAGVYSFNQIVPSADLPLNTWTYIQTTFSPSATAKYIGLQTTGTVGVSRIAGADLVILN